MTPKELQEEALKKAAEGQAKINARIEELKTFVGKTFKRKDGLNPHQTIKIVRYEGIAKTGNGDLAHLFRVESKNPGAIWTPPATQFLSDHEEVSVDENQVKKEVI